MERIGIYGGSFNPPHIGHMEAARRAISELKLDQLLLIPAGQAPHKKTPEGTPAPEHRLEMLRIATQGMEKVRVCDLEIRRDGPSYTYETVEKLRELYPEAELILLMGTDMFLSFMTWNQPERILQNASLGVFCRGLRKEKDAIHAKKAEMEAFGAKVVLVDNPVIEVSSTQMRRMLVFRFGKFLLPRGVDDYIRQHKLYGTDRDYRNLPMEELERVAIPLHDPKRVKHVLGCRDTAARLAKIWGVDPEIAARAGLLHDITKALDGPLQLTLCDEYGTILDDFSAKYPKTLHALTGSLVAERIFGEPPEIVEAIRSHTTGKANMTTLEKIIYVADYMEPNRDFPGVEKLRQLAETDLDAALKCGLEQTLDHLKNQGSRVSPETRVALAWLNENGY